jgi:hypothetical protein
VQFGRVAELLAIMFLAYYLFLIIVPSIGIKATGFHEHLKIVSRFSYLNGVVTYVVNLIQLLLVVFAIFAIFLVYEVFGCISIGYPLLLTILFITAMMSFTFLLVAMFESSKFPNSSGRLV